MLFTRTITVTVCVALTVAAESKPETFDPVLLLGGSIVTGDVERPGLEYAAGGVGLRGQGRTRTLEVTSEWIRLRSQDQPTIEIPTASVVSLAYAHYSGTAHIAETLIETLIPRLRRTGTFQTYVTLGLLDRPGRPGAVVIQVQHSERQRILQALVRASGRSVRLVAEDRRDLAADLPTTEVADRAINLPGISAWPSRRIRAQSVRTIAFSPDGRSTAVASGRRLELWDVSLRSPIGEPLRIDDDIAAMTFAADGRHVVACTGAGLSHRVVVWDLKTRRLVWRMPQRGTATLCQLSESGRWAVLTSSFSAAALLLDVEHRRATPFPSPGLVDLAGDFGVLKKGLSQFNGAEIWRLDPLEPVSRLGRTDLEGSVYAKVVLDEGRRLVVEQYGDFGSLQLLDVATGQVMASTGGARWKPGFPDRQFIFSADRSLVVEVMGLSQTARFWRLPSFEVRPIAGHLGRPLLFALDRSGRRFSAVTSLGHVVIWDVAQAAPIGYCAVTLPGGARSLWIAPDSRSTLVVDSASGGVTSCSEP